MRKKKKALKAVMRDTGQTRHSATSFYLWVSSVTLLSTSPKGEDEQLDELHADEPERDTNAGRDLKETSFREDCQRISI